MPDLSLDEKFWARVDPSDDCWLWQGARHSSKWDYGMFWIGSRTDGTRRPVLAHRFVWELENGPIPEGVQVCHHCDNPPCVRLSHLFLGTQLDNVRDMDAKGRRIPANSLVTHCPRGHPYDESNTRYDRLSKRRCRACGR